MSDATPAVRHPALYRVDDWRRLAGEPGPTWNDVNDSPHEWSLSVALASACSVIESLAANDPSARLTATPPPTDDGGAAFDRLLDDFHNGAIHCLEDDAEDGGDAARCDRLRRDIRRLYDAAIARAERAEAVLRTRTAAEYPAAFAADDAARARLAADRAAIHPTRRDGRVPLGTGAGVGGADL